MAVASLALLSVLIFFLTTVLPGNVARRILGGTADANAVDQLNSQLGTDRPVVIQYWDWLIGLLHGDLGLSFASRQPVSDLLWPAFGNSLKLAALVLILLIPIGLIGGVIAAVQRGKFVDHLVTLSAVTATTIPDFVTGITLILVFALGLKWFPVTAATPQGAGV